MNNVSKRIDALLLAAEALDKAEKNETEIISYENKNVMTGSKDKLLCRRRKFMKRRKSRPLKCLNEVSNEKTYRLLIENPQLYREIYKIKGKFIAINEDEDTTTASEDEDSIHHIKLPFEPADDLTDDASEAEEAGNKLDAQGTKGIFLTSDHDHVKFVNCQVTHSTINQPIKSIYNQYCPKNIQTSHHRHSQYYYHKYADNALA